jgi:S1-C subfamily serine protease
MRLQTDEFDFDVEKALKSLVAVTSQIPANALTASVLGTERQGNGVIIDRGLVLTIGYLVTEAQQIWLKTADGRTVPGDVLGYDQPTGFGLIQALGDLGVPALALGSSAEASVGDPVLVAGAHGTREAISGHLVAKQEFAGYWEYVLDEALFTAPAHPNWGGTAVVNARGELIGVGSLQIQDAEVNGDPQDLNMVVPIDLLKPILDDMRTTGRANRPPRPWLGLYATEAEDHVVIIGTVDNGPAQEAGLSAGDLILAVGDTEVHSLADFFRQVWAQGEAGCDIAVNFVRDGRLRDAVIVSVDRAALLSRPSMH